MSWAYLLLAVIWIIGAWLTLEIGAAVVGDSAAGRKALPVVAALWPVAVFVCVAIGGVNLVDRGFANATEWMCERGEGA